MNGPPRKQVLEQLDALQREIAEYHRWLTEFPQVCRVLENLMLRIERPLPGTEQTRYRSVGNLRDELRAMDAGLVELVQLAAVASDDEELSRLHRLAEAHVSGVKEDGDAPAA